MKNPERILVRSPNWIGDQILSYPFFYFLRQTFPKSHIAVVCVPWVKSIQFRKQVDQVIEVVPSKDDSLLSRLESHEATARIVRVTGPWDLGICLPNSFSAAWVFFRAGVQRRRGYQADARSLLLTESISWKKGIGLHRASAYTQLLFESPDLDPMRFWGFPAENELDPPVPGVLASFDAQAEWPGESLKPLAEPYWVLAPGTTAESRQWPLHSFQAIAAQMAQEYGWKGIILGGPKERELAQTLASDPSLNLEDWTARGSVASCWPIFQKAQFTLSNDSGLAHMASLCGSRVQIVWGAGNPKRTEPIGPGPVQVIFNPVSCWPCERNFCYQPQETRLQCINGMSSELVWKEIQSGIRK